MNVLFFRKEQILKEIKDMLPTYFINFCIMSEKLSLIETFTDASLQ